MKHFLIKNAAWIYLVFALIVSSYCVVRCTQEKQNCEFRGGVLVRGVLGLECVGVR